MSDRPSFIGDFQTPHEAWQNLYSYKTNYYDEQNAMYSGDVRLLKSTDAPKGFWSRGGTNKIHVPIAADIATTSANLLFSQEPKFTLMHEGTEMNEEPQQKRMESIFRKNAFTAMLNEAAETASAFGDVYFKIRWNLETDHPIVDMVQPDSAWAEYLMGELQCVHFFTVLRENSDNGKIWRMYERYTKGEISMAIFEGDRTQLGDKLPDSELEKMGYESVIKTPIDELLAVHVANMKPNRRYRGSMLGRADCDGLRNLCDALDEVYSSWVRDVRLGKARMIVPVEFLKRKPSEMLEGIEKTGSWEFDQDVETFTAMDIDTEKVSDPIKATQFSIRSNEHSVTCSNLITNIVTLAGYSPQSFGLDINGTAQSGTALNIRERKTASTKNKKQTYWQAALETLIKRLLKLDAVLYPSAGSDGNDDVRMSFNDTMGNDVSTMSSAIEMLNRAQSISLLVKVRMLHPDWSESQIAEEVERIKAENSLENPLDPMLGDSEAVDDE